MPLREKLFVMEAIWNDLSRDEGDVEVLHWHKELLDEREQLVMEDKAVFIDWDRRQNANQRSSPLKLQILNFAMDDLIEG